MLFFVKDVGEVGVDERGGGVGIVRWVGEREVVRHVCEAFGPGRAER